MLEQAEQHSYRTALSLLSSLLPDQRNKPFLHPLCDTFPKTSKSHRGPEVSAALSCQNAVPTGLNSRRSGTVFRLEKSSFVVESRVRLRASGRSEKPIQGFLLIRTLARTATVSQPVLLCKSHPLTVEALWPCSRQKSRYPTIATLYVCSRVGLSPSTSKFHLPLREPYRIRQLVIRHFFHLTAEKDKSEFVIFSLLREHKTNCQGNASVTPGQARVWRC